jgi:surface protein
LVSSFETYNICEGALIDNGSNVRKGPQQMLIEGFTDLTSGDTNCILNQAIFEVEVTLSGVSATTTATTFYTGTSINDFPGDDDYYYAVRSLLLGFSGITDVIIEPVQNQITIATICNPSAEYVDAEIIIGIKIYYDISCEDTAPPVLAPFIFIVDTTKLSAGSSLVDQFQLPTVLGGYYDFDVDWGDGNTDVINTWNDVNTLHTYTGVGTYQIIINGQFSGWTFNNSGDRAKVLEVKQWGILELGDSPGHFYGCVNLDLSGTTDVIDLSTTTTFLQSFRNCTSITTINNAEFWDVSTITDMTETFRNATSFNHPIGSWDVSNVTTTIRMFQTAFDFNQDISGWDVSNLVNASNMFTSATSFNQPLNSWNVSNITNMSGMFGSTLLFNQPLSGWNVSNVTNMSNMFSNTAVFNQDISTWDVSNVTTMLSMFATATSFNQPLNGWNVSNVTTMFGMFQNASSFDQLIDLWNVSNVTVMTGMFNNTITFNQDISTWDVSNVTDMTSMLDNCGMNQTKYESLLVNWNLLPSLQLNVNFGVSGRQYQIGSPSDTARSNIIGTYSWTFIGDTAVP